MDIFDKIAGAFGKKTDGAEKLAPVASAVDQTPEEQELVSYVRGRIDMVRQTNSRIAQEGVMFSNIAYLLGFDGVYYDTTYRQFRNVDPKRRLSRSRFKINKILPTIQNRLARLTQSPPKYDVRPNSNSSEDKDCARLGLQIIDYIFDKQNFTEKQQDLLMCAMQGGVAYAHVLWDPTLGDSMVDPETNELSYQGDIRLDVCNMLEIFPDPLAKNLDDAQWVIKAKVRKLDYFKERYPDRGSAVKEEDVWLLSSIYDLKANAMTSVGIVGAQTNEQMRNSAIEIIYEERRSKEHPKGRMVSMASGVLLEDKDLPVGEFDIVKFDDILIGGRYHSEAIITHLRPVQDQYNILRTKCADWIKKTLGGKYLAAKGAGLSQEALNNDSGEVLEANPVAGWPGPPVMPLPIPSIPNYVYEDIRVLGEEFDFISGIGEPTRGVAPGAQMPFRAMALLVEQDQTRISVQTNRNEAGYAKIGSLILKYVAKCYEMPRTMKIAGDGLEYTVKEFMGSEIKENTDVVVFPGSTVPGSKVLKRQDIFNTYQSGLMGDPSDPKLRAKVLREMEFGFEDEVWKDQALDDAAVKKVISAIEEGDKPMPPGHEWDNHQYFIQEMNQYRKTDKYEDLPPEMQKYFNFVIEWHLTAFLQLTQPQLSQNQMMAQHMTNTVQTQQLMNQAQGGIIGQVAQGGGGMPPQGPPPMMGGGPPPGNSNQGEPPMAQGA